MTGIAASVIGGTEKEKPHVGVMKRFRSLRRIVGVLGAIGLLTGLAAAGELPPDFTREDGRTRGNPAAPLTLIEYSDFTCGYCLKFFRETWPRLKAKYVDTGKVRFLYRDFPRGDAGLMVDAAVAARCAGEQGKYWDMHDHLFAKAGEYGAGDFPAYGRALGLNGAAFTTCLKNAKQRTVVFHDRDEGNEIGFRGTPGFVLMRTKPSAGEKPIGIPGAFPYEVFEEEIERLLAPAPTKGKG